MTNLEIALNKMFENTELVVFLEMRKLGEENALETTVTQIGNFNEQFLAKSIGELLCVEVKEEPLKKVVQWVWELEPGEEGFDFDYGPITIGLTTITKQQWESRNE